MNTYDHVCVCRQLQLHQGCPLATAILRCQQLEDIIQLQKCEYVGGETPCVLELINYSSICSALGTGSISSDQAWERKGVCRGKWGSSA